MGIWQLSKSTKKPVDQRLQFYSDRLIKFFLSQGVDKESSKDLSQDVIINLYTSPNKYLYLSSTALIINLARVALLKFTNDKKIDALIRKKYVNPTGDIDWAGVYRLTQRVFSELTGDNRALIEKYWDSKFTEGTFDHIIDEEDAEAMKVDETVLDHLYLSLNDD